MKNNTIDLDDPIKDSNLDDSFFVGFKETSREQLPVYKQSKLYKIRDSHYVLRRDLFSHSDNC